jgi:3-phenylpropionate/trans-cinnamate dioxygenase ferredoxin reductase subunit
VTIVEAAHAPVARVLGAEVGLVLADRWRAHGIDVRLGVGVAHFRADAAGRVASVLLTDGSALRADVVVVGVGVEPVTELLPPRPALHVRAAGDVAGPGHWTAAAAAGAAAARGILGLPVQAEAPAYVWSDQFGLRLQVVGTPRPDHRLVVDGSGDAFVVEYIDDRGATCAGVFANRPAEAAALRRRLAEPAVALAA